MSTIELIKKHSVATRIRGLKDIRITIKFPAIVVALALFAATATGVVAFKELSGQMWQQSERMLSASLQARKAALASYLESVRQDLLILSSVQNWVARTNEFGRLWKRLDPAQKNLLRQYYVSDNFLLADERLLQSASAEISAYTLLHDKLHTDARKVRDNRGHYDLFIIDADGNIVYTIEKKRDFATNLLRGETRDTRLADLFRAIRENPDSRGVVFSDYSLSLPFIHPRLPSGSIHDGVRRSTVVRLFFRASGLEKVAGRERPSPKTGAFGHCCSS